MSEASRSHHSPNKQFPDREPPTPPDEVPLLTMTPHSPVTDNKMDISNVINIDIETYVNQDFILEFMTHNSFGAISGTAYVGKDLFTLIETIHTTTLASLQTPGKEVRVIAEGSYNKFVELLENEYEPLIQTLKSQQAIAELGDYIATKTPTLKVGVRYSKKKNGYGDLLAKEALLTLRAAVKGLHPPVFACGMTKDIRAIYFVESGTSFEMWFSDAIMKKNNMEEITTVMASLWNQMEAAAEFGLLMTDIKTGNMFVDTTRRVKFIDLGADYSTIYTDEGTNTRDCILFVNCVLLLTYVSCVRRNSPGYLRLLELMCMERNFVRGYLTKVNDSPSSLCDLFANYAHYKGKRKGNTSLDLVSREDLAAHVLSMAHQYSNITTPCFGFDENKPALLQYVNWFNGSAFSDARTNCGDAAMGGVVKATNAYGEDSQ